MKTFKLTLLVCILWIINSCTPDKIVIDPSTFQNEEILTWKSNDGLRNFLPADFIATYDPGELEKIEIVLRDEKPLEQRRTEVHLAAGTTNQLAGAIASADPSTVIVLDAGDHFETGTVLINKSVIIEGYGANLIFSNVPGITDATQLVWNIKSGIHINEGGSYTSIRGVTFKGSDLVPAVAVFLDHSKGVKITYNIFENWQFGISGYNAVYSIIKKNIIHANPGWATGAIPESDGIILSDGTHNHLIENEINNGLSGIFTGGFMGVDFGNKTNNCGIGQILCKVPAGFNIINGVEINTQASTSNWRVMFNTSSNSALFGFLVIDGANKCILDHNKASNNGLYDIEVAGDSNRFGFFTPRAYNNRVHAYGNLKVKNCGENTHIIGGTLVDNTVDPCF